MSADMDGLADPTPPMSDETDHDDVSADDVRWMLRNLDMDEHLPLLSMRQVTPSLIVRLFEKLVTIDLVDLRDPAPSHEDDVHNMTVLLNGLRDGGLDLADLSAEQIVRKDPVHVGRLLRIAVDCHIAQQGEAHGRDRADGGVDSLASQFIDKAGYVTDYIHGHSSALQRGTPLPTDRRSGKASSSAATPGVAPVSVRRPTPRAASVDNAGIAADRQGGAPMRVRLHRVMDAVSGAHCHKCAADQATAAPSSHTDCYAALRGERARAARRATERNRLRDERIEKIRAARFIETVRSAELARRVADHNTLFVEKRRRADEQLAQMRRDDAELRRMAKEEDARMREHLANQLASIASARSGRVHAAKDRVLSRAVDREVAPVASARDANLRRYVHSVGSWRCLNPFALSDDASRQRSGTCRRHRGSIASGSGSHIG